MNIETLISESTAYDFKLTAYNVSRCGYQSLIIRAKCTLSYCLYKFYFSSRVGKNKPRSFNMDCKDNV